MYLTWRALALTAVGLVPVIWLSTLSVGALWTVGVLVVCAVDAALAPSPRSVAVRRDVPAQVRLTESASSTLTILNVGRRQIHGEVRDAWEPSAGAGTNRHHIDVPPHERRRVTTRLTPTRRGDRAAGAVTLRLVGPLRLAGRQLSIDVPARLRVLPEFRSRRHLPSRLARLRELDGRSAVQIRGAGSEFDSLREYVIGDDVRSIDWRATGRRSEVVVRTWRPERDRHVFIMIDTSRTAAARIGDHPRLDESIEATLLLAALASHAGDRVQVIAYDRRVRGRVAGASGSALMSILADRLAPIEATITEMDWIGATETVYKHTSQRALVAIMTSVDPAAVQSGLLRAIRPIARKHQVLIGSVDDPELTEMMAARTDVLDVFGAAAATRFDLERQAIAMRMRRMGAQVVTAAPDQLAPAVADAYLDLKKAGKL